MPDKELSHQDSTLLFIRNLQNELAKTTPTGQSKHSEQDLAKMPPPQNGRSQNSKAESQSEHTSRSGCTLLTAEQAQRNLKNGDSQQLLTVYRDLA